MFIFISHGWILSKKFRIILPKGVNLNKQPAEILIKPTIRFTHVKCLVRFFQVNTLKKTLDFKGITLILLDSEVSKISNLANFNLILLKVFKNQNIKMIINFFYYTVPQ